MTFKRVMKLLGTLAGFIVGVTAVIVAYFTRRMVSPARQPLWTTPVEMGLEYENANFPAQDSVRLSGWFIPASESATRGGATIILVHDWTWNRLGDCAADLLADFSGTTPVELLRLAHALHYEGYHVLMYDQRNHGESAAHPPVTFGQSESSDLLGALAYLSGRSDVDQDKIGVIGFSMGANAVLYALPQTDGIAAAIAVQPTTASAYIDGFTYDLLGVPGRVLPPVLDSIYTSIGGVPLGGLKPAFAAAGAGETPVLFVQCRDDAWGSVEDVMMLRSATPAGEGPLLVEGTHRYEGYQYIIENPKVAVAFFERHL